MVYFVDEIVAAASDFDIAKHFTVAWSVCLTIVPTA